MSHFTVLVTRTNKVPLEEQLAPFDENIKMPRYIKFTKEQLIANHRMEIEEYAKTGPYAEYLKDPAKYEAECRNGGHLDYIKNKFPQKLHWTDEEIYQDAIELYEPDQLTPDGGVYSTYNPKSKWDWYQIGGRWSGYFKLKPDGEGRLGHHRAKDFAAINGETIGGLPDSVADIALMKDIDWAAMLTENFQKAKETWIKYKKALDAETKGRAFWEYGIYEDDNEKSYIERSSSPATFAIVHNGVWYEKGEMGWWGMVANKKDINIWHQTFNKVLKQLSPDDELTLVDCHI